MDVKKGDIIVNNKKAEVYFGGIVAKATYEEPLKITNTLGKYTLMVKVPAANQVATRSFYSRRFQSSLFTG